MHRHILRFTFASFVVAALSGCDPAMDPIVGEWKGQASGCNARDRLDIADEQGGDGRIVLGDCSVCPVDVEIDKDGEAYELELQGIDTCEGILVFDCEIDDDTLECEDMTGRQFELDRD